MYSIDKRIVFLFAIAAMILASLACNTAFLQRTAATPVAALPTEDPLPQIPRVSLEDAKAAYDNKDAIFVDVRDVEWYDAGHIHGALSIPVSELESRLDELDPDQWIITYCA